MNDIGFYPVIELVNKIDEIFEHLSTDEHFMYCISDKFLNIAKREDNLLLKKSLVLLSNICSLILTPESINDPFKPEYETQKERAFFPYDLDQKEKDYLVEIIQSIKQPILKSRIGDILWICGSPRNKIHVQTAIENYIVMNVSNEYFDPDIYKFWERAAILAKQIKDNNSIYKIKSKLLDEIENSSTDWIFHKIEIVEIILKTKLDEDILLDLANKLLGDWNNKKSLEEFNFSEQSLRLVKDLFNHIGDKNNANKCTYLLGKEFEKQGDFRFPDSKMAANYFYKQALGIYREIPKDNRVEFGIDNELSTIQEKITQSGVEMVNELKYLSTKSIDISELQEQKINHVKGKKTAFEALCYFSGVSNTNFQEIIQESKKNARISILSNLMGQTSIAPDGRTIGKIPALTSGNSDDVIFKKSIENFSQIRISLIVKGCILPALQQIQEEHIFPKEFLIQLCRLSPIVPEKREVLVANALYQGFEWDFSTSIHLLAPQVENMIRQLLKNNGITTTHTDKNQIEHEKGLSSLVEDEKARNILGDDLWFELQAIFTSSLGSNLRNEVGHGLLDDDTSNSLASVYAWWMILKLIVRSTLKELKKTKE